MNTLPAFSGTTLPTHTVLSPPDQGKTLSVTMDADGAVVSKSIITEDPKFLSTVSEQFDFKNPQMDPIELGQLLVKEMMDQNGLGLSAIQLGIPLRVFAMRAQPQNIVLFNPIIVYKSDETKTEFEGCLSFPNLIVKVKRAFEVRVRYRQANEEVITAKWGGLTARIAQHELDHLDGILFYNKVGKFHRDQAFRKRDQYQRALKQYKKAIDGK
jgi:peptide deformylase